MRYDFSTESVKPAERLRAWQSVVQDACVPLSVRAERTQFVGTISSRDVDELCISLVQSISHEGRHDRPHVARTGGDVLLASIQIAGEGLLEQDGRGASLSGGDMVIYDGTRPFCWSFATGFRQLVVRIPRTQLKFRLAMANSYTARRLPCATGLGRVASDYLISLFREAEAIDPATARRAAGSALDLVVAALTSQAETRAGPRTDVQALMLNQAFACIADHIRDPELDPEMVAHRLGISVRYLHHLFQAQGTSVGRHILGKRLSGCARSLEHDRAGRPSISAIAYSWGFNSAAHFSRVFRAEFGMSARDYRAMRTEGTGSGGA